MRTSALERCAGDPGAFADDVWGRRPTFRSASDPNGFADLLTLDDVDHLVSSAALRLPTFRLINDGATLVLQGLHRFWLPLARFCRELEIELGHPTQVNAYITPPGSRGLAVHEDPHDVFVLQAFGRKHWDVWPTRTSPEGDAKTAAAAQPP